MWTDVVTGLVRTFGPLLVAVLVKRGLTPEDASDLVQWIGDVLIAVATLALAGWSVWDKISKHRQISELKVNLQSNEAELKLLQQGK